MELGLYLETLSVVRTNCHPAVRKVRLEEQVMAIVGPCRMVPCRDLEIPERQNRNNPYVLIQSCHV